MRISWQRALNAGLSVIMAVTCLGAAGGPAAAQDEPEPSAAVSAQAFQAPTGYIVHGAHISPVDTYPAEIAGFETNAGKNLGIVMYFRPWDRLTRSGGVGPCDDGFLPLNVNGVAKPGSSSGRVIMLTWEPLSILANPGPAAYDNILSGAYDTLIDTCASELAAWYNQTFIIRFMHEMNITTSAWWAGHSYNQKTDGSGEGDTAKFIQTWRYVWQRFYDAQQTAGHHNVQWLWAPNWGNNPPDAWNDMNNYYPGDAYVDWIGLSGYNWFPFLGYAAPQSYEELYDATISDLQCRYAKPILHAEIGSTNTLTQSKSAWLTDAFTRMQTYPLLRAVVWFNDYAYHSTDQADFRVTTTKNFGYTGSAPFSSVPAGGSGSVVAAYQTAVAGTSFTTAFDSAKLLNPPMTRCSTDVVSTNGVLGARPASAVVARQGQTTTTFTVGALGFSTASTTFSVSGCPSGATCRYSNASSTSASKTGPWGGDTLTIQAGAGTTLGAATLTITGGGTSVQVALTVVQQIYPLYLPSMLK